MTQTLATLERRGTQSGNAWRVLALLALINAMNFYDRALPAIVVEPLKRAFALSDLQIGFVGGAFTLVYAVTGIVLGRVSDSGRRKQVMVVGLLVWSLFTAFTGLAWGFVSLVVARLFVGVGEASYGPAATSLIADLFPAQKRSRAVGLFQLGLPVGTLLAFLTTGAIVELFGSWRAPFFLAALPGVVLAGLVLLIDEPEPGASDDAGDLDDLHTLQGGADPDDPARREPLPAGPAPAAVSRPIRTLLGITTLRWLVAAGIGIQIANYSVGSFLVPLFQRYFGQSLSEAAVNTGIVFALTGLVALPVSGLLADRASRRSPRGRMLFAAGSLGLAAPLTVAALRLGPDAAGPFVALFAAAWFLQFSFFTASYPVIAEIVEPRLRATAMGVFFAAMYLLGGAFGPVITGGLSDYFAGSSGLLGRAAEAYGLHQSMLVVVPTALALAAVGLLGASRTIARDQMRPVPAHVAD